MKKIILYSKKIMVVKSILEVVREDKSKPSRIKIIEAKI